MQGNSSAKHISWLLLALFKGEPQLIVIAVHTKHSLMVLKHLRNGPAYWVCWNFINFEVIMPLLNGSISLLAGFLEASQSCDIYKPQVNLQRR